MTVRGVVTNSIPEFAHSGREFFRTFWCLNNSAIHDEKLFEIHYGVHGETLLAFLVTPSGSKVVFAPVRQYTDEIRPGRPPPYETPTTILVLLVGSVTSAKPDFFFVLLSHSAALRSASNRC